MEKSKKKTQGRKKIDIEKISRKDYREVTFSKRRNGVFKKASELSTLCGAETALVVFSPADKVFSFGHPSVESVMNRFLATKSPYEVGESSTANLSVIDCHPTARINDLNRQLAEARDQLEAEKKHGKTLTELKNPESNAQFLWNSPVENLEYHELEQLRVSMEELKIMVFKEASERVSQVSPLLHGCSSNWSGQSFSPLN